MTGERIYSVSIETWGRGLAAVDTEALIDLAPALSELGAIGVSASAGGLAGGPGATFSVRPDVLGEGEDSALGSVTALAVRWFNTACEKVGLRHDGIARIDVMAEAYLERELVREPERYAGVSEVAELLGVSRQRIAELRARPDFPEPVAELAAGPIWRVSSLNRFLEQWPRRPGRPRKAAAG